MQTIKNIFPYIVIAGLILFIFGQSFFNIKNVIEKTDTVVKYVTVTTPEKQGEFTNSNPQPIYISQPSNDKALEFLYKKMDEMESDNEKLQFLVSQLSTKVYEKNYGDDDVSITVSDSISGKLLNQSVKWKIKPQEIQVKEVTITKQLKPKFTVSAGLLLQSGIVNPQPTINGIVGLKNKSGYELILGIDTQKTYSIGLKKDLFTKF